ncbi:MAG: ATP-binding cassette domain-containing protein [Candidatus Kariarchaeaceae archaeon]|jgi:ABC-2 type transport system ATP-binding protein
MIISIEGLKKSYGQTDALKGIDFEVPSKQIVGFLGPNGAGKSTTIGIMMQMIKPDTGKVHIFGENILDHGNSIKSRIGLIPDASLPTIPGSQILKHTAWFAGLSGQQLKDRIDTVINIVGGTSFVSRNTKTMSKGQRQRIKIANALLSDPELIIADEPTAGLDPVSRRTLLKLFNQLVKDEGKTIFFSNHVISEVEKISDYLIILNQGEIINKGSIDKIRSELFIPGVYLLEANDIDETFINQLSGVKSVQVNSKGNFSIHTKIEEENTPQFLLELVNNDIRIEHFSRKIVDLEDVFMGVKGK